MNTLLINLLYLVLSAAISVGGVFAAKWLKTNTDLKYKDEIAEAVVTATGYVQQTFVDGAKKYGAFTDAKQEEARKQALKMTEELLSSAALNYLYKDRTRHEVKDYLTALIEESVRLMKKGDQ